MTAVIKVRAVIYARYSSDKQTEQSIEGQLRACYDFAERNGYTVVREYIDRAKTGRNDDRESFQRMISDSAKQEFEVVLVYKLDRFSRSRYDSAHNKRLLKKNGVKVVSATENISDKPEGILLESMLEGLAEYYSAELAQKVSRGMRESVLKGHFLGGQVPYGYNVVKKEYVINKAEAKVVRKIYEMYLDKPNVKEICDWLNSNKIYNKKQQPFKHHQIMNILTKPLYIGTLKAAGLTVEDKVPAIVSKETFMKVQEIASTRSHGSPNTDFLLLGKIFCGDCGKAMTGSSGTGKSKTTYYYYECKKERLLVNKEKIESKVYETIRNFLDDTTNSTTLAVNIDKYIEQNTDHEDEKNITTKIKKIDRELSNIANAVASGIINNDIKIKNEALLDERMQLLTELDKIRTAPMNDMRGKDVCEFLSSLAKVVMLRI